MDDERQVPAPVGDARAASVDDPPPTAGSGGGATAGGLRPPVRLIDVAVVAGVSQKTVSNVVNDYPHVSARTRERVLAAIETLGYRPNLSARNLARGRSGIVALVIPELHNPYFSRLTDLTLREADRLSLAVLIEQTGGVTERERLAISRQRSRLVDGIIMSVSALDAKELAQRTGSTPLVVLGERVFDGSVDHVAGDNVAAARDVTQHLLDEGRRRIAVIGMERALQPGLATLRHAGYVQALEGNDVPFDDRLVLEVPSLTRTCGREAVDRLLESETFDAIVCFNDLLAMGALKSLAAHGVSVPDDVAVAGFDNTEEGEFGTPALTTVDWDTAEIVHRAVEVLHERIDGRRDVPPADILVPHRLIVRESTRTA